MADKLNFSLPEKKGNSSAAVKVSIILLVVVIIVAGVNLAVVLTGRGAESVVQGKQFSAEQTKELASKLMARNLYAPAVNVWREYLTASDLSGADSAKVLFEIGKLLEKDGRYSEAIEYYYRSEMAGKVDGLDKQIDAHIKDCFERLGKFSALRYELMDRTSLEGTVAKGSKIIAEIGAEKITEADLDAVIERQIDNQLSQYAAFMSPEQLSQQKQTMLEQFKSPQVKVQQLQGWLTQEVLYREALKDGLAQERAVQKVLEDLRRTVLSSEMMNRQLASKINITESDLQTYYTANKEDYLEPVRAKIRHILVEDETLARDLIKRIQAGDDFGELAKQFSKDEATSQAGGVIGDDILSGKVVAGIGTAEQLNEKIFSTEAGIMLEEPVQTDKGWEIVKVDGRSPARQKSFEEVGQDVASVVLGQKRQETQQDYSKKLWDEYSVVVHRSVLMGTQESQK